MDLTPLPLRSSLDQYHKQAEGLLNPKNVQNFKIQSAGLELADAQLAIARWYEFQSWPALSEFVGAVNREGSSVCQFESAVETVINGDIAALASFLHRNPDLIRARSTRVHRATLLHYVAANGVEGYRQKTPENAVEVARVLLNAGAEVDALAEMYGGRCTTMSMLVSSCHPAKAGMQVALIQTLLDFGAALEGSGEGQWRSPLMTALAFGYQNAAEALAKRGAKVNNLAAVAGLGRLTETRELLATADGESRHRALALAAQHGHADIVGLLLDAGEDPSRFNPDGNHSHSTPLHQAALAGHDAVVRLLVERGARLDIQDAIYRGTPLGWAKYAGQTEIEKYLRAHARGNEGN